MNGINKAILIGNLGRDPEVRTLESGVKVATFSIATTETYKNKNGEKVDQTEWHNIVMWRGLAEVAEKYLNKGNQIYLEGRIRTRTYEKDGQTKYMTEIVADQMTMLGGRRSDTQEEQTSKVEEPNVPEPKPDDDLPF